MSYKLKIIMDQTEGILLRTTGLIERRGFSIKSLKFSKYKKHQKIITTVEPLDDKRSVDVLIRQVERLIDVQTVEHIV